MAESKITWTKVYAYEESAVASWYAMQWDRPWDIDEAIADTLTMKKADRRLWLLAKDPRAAHANALAWILVQADFSMTNKWWIEAERYHRFQILTSQSTMHRIAKMDLKLVFNDFVAPSIIKEMQKLQDEYNANPTRENYLRLLYSCPSWIVMTARVSTNYLQLRNMLHQRAWHILPEWSDVFVERCMSLPKFNELLAVWGQPYEHSDINPLNPKERLWKEKTDTTSSQRE